MKINNNNNKNQKKLCMIRNEYASIFDCTHIKLSLFIHANTYTYESDLHMSYFFFYYLSSQVFFLFIIDSLIIFPELPYRFYGSCLFWLKFKYLF